MHRYYLLIIWHGVEIKKVGPFYSADARDQRALELNKRLDSQDSLFWLDFRGRKMSAGSYPTMFFEQEEYHHAEEGRIF
jgi:hypothetical protein